MSATTKRPAKGRKHPLPIKLTESAKAALDKILSLLANQGIYITPSELIRTLCAPCFVEPEPDFQRRLGHSFIYGPMPRAQLAQFLTPRFRAWVDPLIESKHAIVRIDPPGDGICTLWIWVSVEHAFGMKVLELEQAACAEEKSGRSETCVDKPTTTILTKKEKRAAMRRAKRLGLKRSQTGGHSRYTRLTACHALKGFLAYLEETIAARQTSQPSNPPPKGSPGA